jgi:hypothetical protein
LGWACYKSKSKRVMIAQNKNKINNKKEKGESREKFDESYK